MKQNSLLIVSVRLHARREDARGYVRPLLFVGFTASVALPERKSDASMSRTNSHNFNIAREAKMPKKFITNYEPHHPERCIHLSQFLHTHSFF
ncbi:uncharacterized protein BDR25DRAFT_360562 [Lindgomyces ingoldianus]|uniref:Uncharacterized protein n=1 Tax=Lindgomyces ingoldianus TaxID=673940 RepID=A0ACB6QGY9_9PLEO|nr:uncharacterized protein BDR25DRAFT_360562 [Lindgomyces ingoldianus]KAF2465627.1 hypothetical protein BDR25DRAFT_360562 [Lindgomyces ingoldianus]